MLTFVRFPWKQTDFLAFLNGITNHWEGSIMKVSSTVALAASSVLALGSIAPAFAHELRILLANHGKISLLVGHHVEPAFEDSFNAVDVILSTFDGACPAPNTSISIGQPIDADGTMAAKDPDTVNLQVDALYLFKSVPPTGPFGSIAPVGIITQLTFTNQFPLQEAFSKPGTIAITGRPIRAMARKAPMVSMSMARSMPVPTVFPARLTRPRERLPREPRRSMPITFVVPPAASLRQTTSVA
jgi:hypothetical protein